jgi:hypothetical protein
MMNRVKVLLGRRNALNPLDSYFFNVQRHSGNGGPTFDEARRDFGEMVRKSIYN